MKLAPLLPIAGLLLCPCAHALELDATPLTSSEKAKEICLGLRPSERLELSGSPAEKAAALKAFEAQREQLRATRFATELVWADFTVADWNAEEKRVTIATERPLRALGGQLSLFDLERDSIELEAIPGQEALLLQGLAKGSLTLALAFQPAEEDSCPCTVSKLGDISLAIDLLSAELRSDSRPVARGVGKGLEPMSREAGESFVEIRAADLDSGQAPAELVDALRRASPAMLGCYSAALGRRPMLDGSLVLDVRADAAGKLRAADPTADSLQDSETTACVRAAIEAASGPKRACSGTVVVELGVRGKEKDRVP